MIHAKMLHSVLVSELSGLKLFTPSVVLGATREAEMAVQGTKQQTSSKTVLWKRPTECPLHCQTNAET